MLDPLREFDKNILPEEPPAAEAEAGEHLGERAQDLLPDGDQDAPLRTAREPERDTANVAVVFVHGMGTSKPGDMLESYMNPSLEWIKRATTDDNSWYLHNNLDRNLVEGVNILERQRMPGPSPVSRRLSSSPETSAAEDSPTISDEVDIGRLRNSVLHSTDSTPANFQPPYVEADLKLREDETTTTKKLVAVEAWWDGEFEAPAFR